MFEAEDVQLMTAMLCELSTFTCRAYAGVGHGAGPAIGKVRFNHACLSSIPLPLFLYLLQGKEEEAISKE